jgi:predicted dehydrogenase
MPLLQDSRRESVGVADGKPIHLLVLHGSNEPLTMVHACECSSYAIPGSVTHSRPAEAFAWDRLPVYDGLDPDRGEEIHIMDEGIHPARRHAPASPPIRVGIIGLGNRGRYFAREWDTHPRCSVVACCDRDPAVLAAARSQLEALNAEYYESMDTMLAAADLDAVVVATHDRHHAECALAVLQADRHLFLEKPMAQRVEDCDAIIRAWERSDRVLMVGLELRYCTLAQAMRRIVDRKDIGDIRVAYAVDNVSVGGDYYYHGPRRRTEYTVSLILEKGTHTLDLMNWFVGSDPVRIYSEAGLDVFGGDAPDDLHCPECTEFDTCPYAVGERGVVMDYGNAAVRQDRCVYAREVDVADNSVTTVRYANGAKLTYVECHFTPDYNRHFILIGTKGRMEAFYNNEQEFFIEVTYRHSRRRDRIYPPKVSGSHGGGDPMILEEFLRRVARKEHSCPGVIGARNSAAIAIRAHEASIAGQVRTIEPYKRQEDLTYPW